MGNIKNGKFVYKNEDGMKKMHEFYDKTLASLDVPYSEDYFDTSFGKTHSLIVGNPEKPRICTIHGGNGITTLNLKLFLPLLQEYCIIAPDVIGMPGKRGSNMERILRHYDVLIQDGDETAQGI